MKRVAILCVCTAALLGLVGCGSSATAEAGTTDATIARLALSLDGEPTGDVWTAVSGPGGSIESVETRDPATGESRYAPGPFRWDLIRLTREFPGPADDVVQGWIDASAAGRKPGGVLELTFLDATGQETSTYNIERWHVESFNIGPFNSKESSELQQSVTIRAEKISKK